jgi:hypothetical protein
MGSLIGRLVAGSRDGTARAWELAMRQASLILVPSAGGGAATPDGTWLGSGDPGEWCWSAGGFTRVPPVTAANIGLGRLTAGLADG